MRELGMFSDSETYQIHAWERSFVVATLAFFFSDFN